MEAVMLVEVLDDHGRVHVRARVAGAGGRCRIGRGLGCDVIVDDPFVAAEHVLLELQQERDAQAVQIATKGNVDIRAGGTLDLHADTICVHGDRPDAALFARKLREGFKAAGVEVTKFAG